MMALTPELIASRKHTLLVLAIVAVLTLLGIAQLGTTAVTPGPRSSRVVPYLVLIALQWLWVRFVRAGMNARGHALSELTGGRWASRRQLVSDVLFAIAAFVAAHGAAELLKIALGGVESNTAFLLPEGLTESALWVCVSIAAGVSEEIVFRGYLQRQLTAVTGSAAAAVLLQALIFGISHGYQGLKSMAITGAYGLVLGLVAWYRGNVRAGMLAHAVTDIVGGLVR